MIFGVFYALNDPDNIEAEAEGQREAVLLEFSKWLSQHKKRWDEASVSDKADLLSRLQPELSISEAEQEIYDIENFIEGCCIH